MSFTVTKGYDIALLELSEPINFKTSKIRPVCFPTAGKAYENTTAKVMGWGKTSWCKYLQYWINKIHLNVHCQHYELLRKID